MFLATRGCSIKASVLIPLSPKNPLIPLNISMFLESSPPDAPSIAPPSPFKGLPFFCFPCCGCFPFCSSGKFESSPLNGTKPPAANPSMSPLIGAPVVPPKSWVSSSWVFPSFALSGSFDGVCDCIMPPMAAPPIIAVAAAAIGFLRITLISFGMANLRSLTVILVTVPIMLATNPPNELPNIK